MTQNDMERLRHEVEGNQDINTTKAPSTREDEQGPDRKGKT